MRPSPIFVVFLKLNEGGPFVAFDHGALISIIENGSDAVTWLVRRNVINLAHTPHAPSHSPLKSNP